MIASLVRWGNFSTCPVNQRPTQSDWVWSRLKSNKKASRGESQLALSGGGGRKSGKCTRYASLYVTVFYVNNNGLPKEGLGPDYTKEALKLDNRHLFGAYRDAGSSHVGIELAS